MKSNTIDQILISFRNNSESFKRYGKYVSAVLRSSVHHTFATERKTSINLFFLSKGKWHQVIMDDVLYIISPD
jgi:hypothetical protein